MASHNGSLFSWQARPAKLIEPLAYEFHELERNIWYTEREGEFDEPMSDDEANDVLAKEEDKHYQEGLLRLDKRQLKLAK